MGTRRDDVPETVMATDREHQEVKVKKTHAAVTGGESMLKRYQNVIVGRTTLAATIYYEWCMWIGMIPGAVGLLLRKIFWSRLFASCGRGVMFGTNIVVRHPNRIHLGANVVISDGCILDARNDHSDSAIVIGDDVILSNNVMLSSKNGTIRIGPRSGLGAQTQIQSTNDCPVTIGADVAVGPQCFFIAGGNYNIDRLDIPIWKQGIKPDSGVMLADDIWLGANVSVIGGVTVGTGSILAAGAVVTRPVPDRAIFGGVPAKLLRMRPGAEATGENPDERRLRVSGQ